VNRYVSIDRGELKRLILQLLREDEEFRLAVAGLIGLREVLDEIRRLRDEFNALVRELARRWEENRRMWEENWKRWEENERRWIENDGRWEENERRWMENEKNWEENWRRWAENEERWRRNEEYWAENWRRWEENEKRWEENRQMWEENWRRWKENERRWIENEKKWEENWRRWEENRRMWEENWKRWEENQRRWEEAERKFRWIMSALEDIRRALGVGLEYYTARVVRELLRERGMDCDVKIHVTLPIDGLREVDVMCFDPLVVGEVTTSVRTVEEAEKELEKLKLAAEAAEKLVGKPTYMRVLAIWHAPSHIAQHLMRRADELGVRLIIGGEGETPP